MKIPPARFGVMATLLGGLTIGGASQAFAADQATQTETTTTVVKKKQINKHHAAAVSPDADNTATNKRDREDTEPTADQQGNDKADISLTADIRRSVMADKNLSINAHNIKIITAHGKVTLKGPVDSAAEKKTLEHRASAIAGAKNVVSEIEVKS